MTPTEYFKGKVVLVTGAGGSIGSEICRQLVAFGVQELRMVGHSEAPLYDIDRELDRSICWPILGSVCNEKLMMSATQGVDVVIHAAAHKHVPLCEQNPLEAIINNIGGTMTLARAASLNDVARFVFISTDKAVKPKSIMGMTKRVCELFISYLNRCSKTEFSTVRFGNVLDSSGSVLPLWREQLKAGKPITLTDKRCTRYFMSIPDAVNLTLSAATLGSGTYVLDMGEPRNMYDLAWETLSKHFGERGTLLAEPLDSMIVETGLRPGEKLTEELHQGVCAQTSIPRVLAVFDWEPFIPSFAYGDLVNAARIGAKDIAVAALKGLVK